MDKRSCGRLSHYVRNRHLINTPCPAIFGTGGETQAALYKSVQGAEHESECLR